MISICTPNCIICFMEIRKFHKSDTQEVAELLHNSVKILNLQGSSEHTHSQAAANISFHNWEESFLQKFTIVAELNRTIVGIGQLDNTGHINWFYCHPDYRRRGIGGQLYAALEEHAYWKNIQTLYTEANSGDTPFFVKMGFQKVHKQNTLIKGEIKNSFVLQKKVYPAKD